MLPPDPPHPSPQATDSGERKRTPDRTLMFADRVQVRGSRGWGQALPSFNF